MRIVSTTDGKFIGCQVDEVVRGSVLELRGYSIPVVFVIQSGAFVIAGNANYIITFEQE
jgi:hypothetical protein